MLTDWVSAPFLFWGLRAKLGEFHQLLVLGEERTAPFLKQLAKSSIFKFVFYCGNQNFGFFVLFYPRRCIVWKTENKIAGKKHVLSYVGD